MPNRLLLACLLAFPLPALAQSNATAGAAPAAEAAAEAPAKASKAMTRAEAQKPAFSARKPIRPPSPKS